MPVASGSCPSCGAPIEFSVGASVSKICEHCRATVFRTDRGLEDLGKVAAIANVPSLVAVGDEGTLAGRPIRVLGRVQLDHGAGPWEEYYVDWDHGAAWGWLAYAEGNWYSTALTSEHLAVPAFDKLALEADVSLGQAGRHRVCERKQARVTSAEGELPGRIPPGSLRRYADLWGPGDRFATLDYGDGSAAPEVFTGKRFKERALAITALGPRSAQKVKLGMIRCPSCGGDLPALSGERAERVGCRYCGAVSDIAERRVIAAQETAGREPPIPIGAKGSLHGVTYTCIAYLQRSALFDGERFTWDELLLFAVGTGYRWLIRDDKGWLFARPVNLAEIGLHVAPHTVAYKERRFTLQNESTARVDYVLGEVYWKCEVGETVEVGDYTSRGEVLSREASEDEVRWSLSSRTQWPDIARAFGVPVSGGGATTSGLSLAPGALNMIVLAIVAVIAVIIIVQALSDDDSATGSYGSGGGVIFGGSGTYHGGK